MNDPADESPYRAQLEMRIAKYHSLKRRVATSEAAGRVRDTIAELENELVKLDK
jgi:hypothetical protein